MSTWTVCLGGADLEMAEIAKLLALHDDVEVVDHHLAWGAKASAYRDEIARALAAGRRVALVELLDDLGEFPREHLVWVDHHGLLAGRDRPTSIEQVFRLFGFPPELWTRDRMLVAANDRGHIRAMQQAGATDAEIAAIRARDRMVQGITPTEEAQGKLAAASAERRLGGRLTVVHLPHNRTATVTDVLDPALGGGGYENLLILSPTQTIFFGSGRAIDSLRAAEPGGWYGGNLPEYGYWGTGHAMPESEWKPILESSMTRPANEILVEKLHHILLWPLIIRGHDTDADINGWIHALPNEWRDVVADKETAVASDVVYEEVVYYHPFARDFLYTDGQFTRDRRACRRLARTDVQRVKVTVNRLTGDRPLDLKVVRVELYLCKPNIAVFCLEVSNQDASGAYTPIPLDVVHDFRDQFRRVHPPFWWDGRTDDAKIAGLCPTAVEWETLTASKELALGSPRSEFVKEVRAGAEPPVFAHWRCWFGNAIRPLDRFHDPKELKPTDLYYQQIMDERMQCMTYLAVENPHDIGEGDRDRLTFVDAAGTDSHPYYPDFLARDRDKHIYDRFAHYKTNYYFCGFAFTALGQAWEGDPAAKKPSFFATHALSHFREHYYRMGVLAHYQRAALLYFADEMATAAKLLAKLPSRREAESVEYRERMTKVQMEFLKFRSRSYFPEVTNQLQGSEMNRLWHRHLGVRKLFDQVDSTCDQINEVFTQKEAERLAVSQENLARVATVFLVPALVLAFLSLLFDAGVLTPASETWGSWLLYGVGLIAVLSASIGVGWCWAKRKF